MKRWPVIVAAGVACVALIASLWRIRFGVDFTDESFYLSMPLRFVLGDRPFVDELNVAQSAALITWPVVWLIHAINHGSDGLVLGMRTCFVLVQLLTGCAVMLGTRRRIGTPAAILLGSCCLALVPYGIPALSYNTLGCGWFAIGSFSAWPYIDDPESRPRWPLFVSGVAHALAALAYPTLAIPVVLITLVLAWRLRRRLRLLVLQLGGAALVCLAVAPLMLRAGGEGLRRVMAYSAAGAVGGSGKLSFVAGIGWLSLPRWVWAVMLLAVPALALVSRRLPRVAFPLVIATPLLAACSLYTGVLRSLAFVIYAAMLAAPLALTLADRALAGRIMLGLWLPSLVAGLATAWTSSNGTIAAGLGLLPAALAGGMLLARLSSETAERTGQPLLERIAFIAPLPLLVCLQYYQLRGDCIYRDQPIERLPVRIAHGPWRGLWTTGQKAQYLDDLEKDLLPLRSQARIGCYYDFPACYLLTDMRPSLASTWTAPNVNRNRFDVEYFDAHQQSGNLAVKILDGRPNTNVAPIDAAVQSRYQLVVQRTNFALYRAQ